MDKKDIALESYFEKHIKVKDIANLLDISSAYITKVIKADARYDDEKIARKNATIERHRKVSYACVVRSRERKKADDYIFLKEQHRQAVYELSVRKYLSNEKYRSWNTSAYSYNNSKRCFEFKNELGRSADAPTYVKIRI